VKGFIWRTFFGAFIYNDIFIPSEYTFL